MPRQLLFLIVFASFLSLAAIQAQRTPLKPAQAQSAKQPKNSSESSPGKAGSAASQQDIDALKADLQRMRVILNQMQTNLAFVQTTQTPLKHQFELEVEMWQVMLNQMERRIQEMEHAR